MFRTSSLVKKVSQNIISKTNATLYINFARHASELTRWNKDWKPGPYPRTQEERIAAAKKYNMIPEDYEPYPEEEGFGDYPMFKKFHMESRNPHEPYDWEALKRNYGEIVHPDYDICIEDRTNFDRKFKTPLWRQFLYLSTGITLFFSFIYWDNTRPVDLKAIPKQFPYSGQVYYTFEAEE